MRALCISAVSAVYLRKPLPVFYHHHPRHHRHTTVLVESSAQGIQPLSENAALFHGSNEVQSTGLVGTHGPGFEDEATVQQGGIAHTNAKQDTVVRAAPIHPVSVAPPLPPEGLEEYDDSDGNANDLLTADNSKEALTREDEIALQAARVEGARPKVYEEPPAPPALPLQQQAPQQPSQQALPSPQQPLPPYPQQPPPPIYPQQPVSQPATFPQQPPLQLYPQQLTPQSYPQQPPQQPAELYPPQPQPEPYPQQPIQPQTQGSPEVPQPVMMTNMQNEQVPLPQPQVVLPGSVPGPMPAVPLAMSSMTPAVVSSSKSMAVTRPKGWDQCLKFARYIKAQDVVGVELIRTWRSTCQPAVQSGAATERYRLMCNALTGAVEPYAAQADYDVEQLCDSVLAVFHDVTGTDQSR